MIEVKDELLVYYQNLENTLRWIKHMAALHYYGDAFDPEHMRSIANLAADALAGWQHGELKVLPDYEASAVEARERAAKWADKLWGDLTDDPDTADTD